MNIKVNIGHRFELLCQVHLSICVMFFISGLLFSHLWLGLVQCQIYFFVHHTLRGQKHNDTILWFNNNTHTVTWCKCKTVFILAEYHCYLSVCGFQWERGQRSWCWPDYSEHRMQELRQREKQHGHVNRQSRAKELKGLTLWAVTCQEAHWCCLQTVQRSSTEDWMSGCSELQHLAEHRRAFLSICHKTLKKFYEGSRNIYIVITIIYDKTPSQRRHAALNIFIV